MNESTSMLSKMISFISCLPTSKIKIQQHPVMSQVESDQEHLCMMNPLDHEEFRRQGHMVIDFIANYYRDIEKYPVRSQVDPGYLRTRIPENAPYNPEPIETILQDVQNHIVPGLTHWLSPYHFAYYPANASIAASLGEILCTGFNVDGFNWMASPAATELENIVMDWLGKMLELPESFLFSGNGGGVIQGTTGDAVLCTVIAARDQLLNRIGRENILKLVVYGSDQTHCSLQKAAKIAGIHPNNVRSVKTTRSMAFALSPDSLRSAIISDKEAGLIPLYLCATVGTTSSGAVDPVGPLCDVAEDYGIWIHIDAAYAGSACICPEFRHFINGVEGANSFSFNPHKWLLTNLDCCCLWVKDPGALVSAFSTNSEYLKNTATDSKQVVDYKDWQVPLTRRFRAIKLWLVLRSYGVVNLRNYVRRHVEMAKHFEGLISMDKRFEVVVPRKFSLVCFRISPSIIVNGCTVDDEESANELNRKLLKSLNDSGRVCMTHAIVGGMYMIRFSIGQPLTDYRHIEMAWKVVQEHTDAMLGSYLK